MEKPGTKQSGDRIFPVFLWIFLAATVAVLLILIATVMKRNGTWDRWKKSATQTAQKTAEKTVPQQNNSRPGHSLTEDAGVGEIGDSQGTDELAPSEDPLRQTLTGSPVKGSEAWWKDAVKLRSEVTVYAGEGTTLYASPKAEAEPVGKAAKAEPFVLFAVLKDGWYVVTDGAYYYCSEGNRYTLVKPEPFEKEEAFFETEQERVEHKVSCILQNPELPHGCEVTGLAMLLDYYGVTVDKCELADTWLPKGAWGETDFREAFVGSPRKTKASAGCYAVVVEDTANRYLAYKGEPLTAESREGVSFRELLSLLEEAPVLVWTTMELKAPYIAQIWTVDSEELYWQNYEHCVVLTGYDREQGVLYGHDPLYGPQEYDAELFSLRFQTMFSQVVRLRTEATS